MLDSKDKFVLEYLRGKGHVILPRTVPKALYSAYLFYYGIINVDESKIVRISTVAGLHHRRQWEGVVRAEIKSWNIRIAIGLLAKVCAINHVDSGEKLVFTIQHDDITRLSLQNDFFPLRRRSARNSIHNFKEHVGESSSKDRRVMSSCWIVKTSLF